MAWWQWSKTPASNANADSSFGWPEGMPPGLVNDSARAMMARLAEFRDDTSGLLLTAGTSTAYTVTTNQGLAATPNDGQLIAFSPHTGNGPSPTLSADGGTAFPIQTNPGSAIPTATLIQGTPCFAKFSLSSLAWILGGFYNSPLVPLGTVLDYTGSTAPSSNFALAAGQAISRTTFAPYFALVGTTYGVGDGSTTFNIADLRGRVIAGQDNMGGAAAGRIGTALVTDGGTINGQTLGSVGGSQSHVQTTLELVTHNHTGSGNVTDPGHTHTYENPLAGGGNAGGAGGSVGVTNTGSSTSNITVPTLNINNSGSSNAMAWLQPTVILTKIIRVQ